MKETTYEATVENGQVRLPESVSLPEHAKVFVIVPAVGERAVVRVGSPRLARPEDACDFEMDVAEESPDAGLR